VENGYKFTQNLDIEIQGEIENRVQHIALTSNNLCHPIIFRLHCVLQMGDNKQNETKHNQYSIKQKTSTQNINVIIIITTTKIRFKFRLKTKQIHTE